MNPTSVSNVNKLAGYTWVPRRLDSLSLTSGFIAVEEEKTEKRGSIFLPQTSSVIVGRVLKAGELADDCGIEVGDRVVYQQFMGGRWEFDAEESPTGGQRCLIMDIGYVILVIKE